MNNLVVPEGIQFLSEAELQERCPITNHLGGGVYMREMRAPAGTLLLGHEHRGDHMCVLLKGKMRLLNDNGTTSDLEAPMIFTARAGRKLALVLEDISFMNVHSNLDEERDISKLEERFVDKSKSWTEHQLTEGAKLLKGEL